jgi:hypothetical protein
MKIALRGATVAFINSPGAEDRVKLVSNAVDAAKSVGVKHLVVVSGASVASKTPSIFKAQFAAIGEQSKTSAQTPHHQLPPVADSVCRRLPPSCQLPPGLWYTCWANSLTDGTASNFH